MQNFQSLSEDYGSGMKTEGCEYLPMTDNPLPDAADSTPHIDNPGSEEKGKGKREAVAQIQTNKRGKHQDFATKSSYRDEINIGVTNQEVLQEQPRIEAASKLGDARHPEAFHGQHNMEQDFESRDMSYFDPNRRVSAFEPPSIFPRRFRR